MCCLSLHPLSVCKFAFGFFKGGLGSALARVQNNKGQSTPAMATKKLMATKNTAGWAGVGLPNNCWVGWGRHSRWPQTHTLPKRGQSAPAMATRQHCKVGWGRVAKQLLGGLGSALAMPTKNCRVGWGRHSRWPQTHITKKRAVGAHHGYEKHCRVGWGRTAKTAGWAGVGTVPRHKAAAGLVVCGTPRTFAMSGMKTAKSSGRLLCLL